jgi:biofilm PGA synthesis N-glycosyltransferase PgaC
MVLFLTVLWLLSLLIVMGYHLAVFRIHEQIAADNRSEDLPGVSIVIAVKNGSDQLIKNLKTILHQHYPLFEIVIVDDYSDLNEKNKLEAFAKQDPLMSFFGNTLLPGKKQALEVGIEKARYAFILCTDADCHPSTTDWIKSMVTHADGHEMVLGYSPYIFEKGWLNQFVRFETVMTGIQYLSWAMAGKPYMGVGRNILYPKKLFLQADPYKGQHKIPYGDDDLWVQQATSLTKVNVNIDAASFVYSDPPHSWRAWFKQKHRHLSAGHHYKNQVWWQPGLFGLALVVHSLFFPILLYLSFTNWIGLLFFACLLIRWMVYAKWTTQLGDRDTVKGYPLLEVVYALYLAGMGLFTLIVKKKSWN